MHTVVKFTKDDDGSKILNDKWHYVLGSGGCFHKLCTNEVFGYSESASEFTTKTVEKGGITCSICLETIREFKNIKL